MTVHILGGVRYLAGFPASYFYPIGGARKYTESYTDGMAVKTAISLPNQVFADLEASAAEQGLSRSAVVLAAVEKYLFDRETARLIAEWTAAVNELTPGEVAEDLAWAKWGHEHLERLAAEQGDTWVAVE